MHSIELGSSPTRHGVNMPTYPTTHVGGSSQELLYMPAGMCEAQQTQFGSPGSWASPDVPLHPGSASFDPSPSFTPTTLALTAQPVTQNGLPVSANPQNYILVPQRQYALTAYHFTPAHPISFNTGSGEPGIRLSAALNRRFTHLEDRDDLVFESSRSPTITMRLEVCGSIALSWALTNDAGQWPGYISWSRQVRGVNGFP